MDATARHDAIVALLRREARGGVVSFARLVEAALYAPGLGYYVAAGLATEQGDDGVMSGRGLHGRSVMRSFPLRQTNRD